MLFKTFVRPLLFAFDPERSHHVVTWLLSHTVWLNRIPCRLMYSYTNLMLKQEIAGIEFDNPVGLAAGFDKSCSLTQVMPLFGFSHMEVGTITAEAQLGNPKPRLFRRYEERALVNRMGFNNSGAKAARGKLEGVKRRIPLGVNIGKSRVTMMKHAVEDYLTSFTTLEPYADYITVNVSSPNTPGLRALQEKGKLTNLLQTLQEHNKNRKPIFVKIAPELTDEQLDDVISVVKKAGISGIIATNTKAVDGGGMSGKPLHALSLDRVRTLYKKTGGKIPIIGVGGIFSAEDAYAMIKSGASLVQIYTGFVYEGPGIVKRINKGLVKMLKRDGYKNISEAVGVMK